MSFIARNNELNKASGVNRIEVTASGTVSIILPANTARKSFILINNSNQILSLGFTAQLTESNGIELDNKDFFENNVYTGPVYGVWKSNANNGCVIWEFIE